MISVMRRHFVLTGTLSLLLVIDIALFYAQLPSFSSIAPMVITLEIYLVLALLVFSIVAFWKYKYYIIPFWCLALACAGTFADYRAREIQDNAEEIIAPYVKGVYEINVGKIDNKSNFAPHKDCSIDKVIPVENWRRIDFQINCSNSGKWLVSTFIKEGGIQNIFITPR